MSGVSRRALLGYSGSAAAGAVVASSGSAQAAESQATGAAAAGTQAAGAGAAGAEQASAVEWPFGGEFSGISSLAAADASMTVRFSLEVEHAPSGQNITPLDIADAINKLVQARGWPPVKFHGMVRTPLN
ncbi:hypothetical protein JQK87_25480 [Streptomyces sp. G44]|uniref:hypothetical protein n=1 Tax=Streptomyces sp. G44 TaxID=2807632 RepID=UPI001960BC62|nr:hypothetical protein [Streptomyces sp. G44]MBM7171694.1 hypothetical protein [Streptomyces sp. G44]